MKKILSSLIAVAFVAAFGASSVAMANDAVAKACAGKKAGEMVKVDGKDVKCPEAKK
jgi:hypothetical protein